jgi:hypothetical protein
MTAVPFALLLVVGGDRIVNDLFVLLSRMMLVNVDEDSEIPHRISGYFGFTSSQFQSNSGRRVSLSAIS